MNLCVWDPGIDFKFRALTGYAANVEMLQLQGCSGKFCVIAYSNSMTRVWDPGESWCVNSSSQRGAIRGLGFAYVSAQTEQICSSLIPIFKGATTLVVLAFRASFLELIFVCSCNGQFALAAMLQEWKVLKLRSAHKVKLQVVHLTGYTFYGVIQMIDLVAHLRRLHHGLGNALMYSILLNKCVVAGQVITELNLILLMSFSGNKEKYGCNWLIAERFSGDGASKTVHRYLKVDNFSFEGSERVKEYCLYHISSALGASSGPSSTLNILGISLSDTNTCILAYYVCVSFDRQGIDVEEEWGENGIIADSVSHICELLLKSVKYILQVAASNASKLQTMMIIVQKPNKNNEVEPGILQAANKIMILPFKIFTCCSERVYNTPKLPDQVS